MNILVILLKCFFHHFELYQHETQVLERTVTGWSTYAADNSDGWEWQLASTHPGVLSGSTQVQYSQTWEQFLCSNTSCKIM